MHPIRRTAAALATATLAFAPLAHAEAATHPGPHGAHAAHGDKAGGKSGKSGKAAAQTRAAVKQVAAKDRALARVAASRGITRLPDEQESVLVASIAADRTALAALRDAVVAGTTTPRAARLALRGVRVENYHQAVAVLRDAAELADVAVDQPDVLALVDAAVEAVLGVTATGGRAALRSARSGLEDAWALYEELTAEPEECTVDEAEDCSDDGSDDDTDDGGDTPELEPLG